MRTGDDIAFLKEVGNERDDYTARQLVPPAVERSRSVSPRRGETGRGSGRVRGGPSSVGCADTFSPTGRRARCFAAKLFRSTHSRQAVTVEVTDSLGRDRRSVSHFQPLSTQIIVKS